MLSERTEAADDALNRVKRFADSVEKLTAWYKEIGDDLDKTKSAVNLTEPTIIDKMVDDVGRISTILQSKMATREIMSREFHTMNLVDEDNVQEKLTKLEQNGLNILHARVTKETLYYIPSGWIVLEKASSDSNKVVPAARV